MTIFEIENIYDDVAKLASDEGYNVEIDVDAIPWYLERWARDEFYRNRVSSCNN